ILHLGENRPQELWRKAAALPPGVHWHLIGHLQRNKIERTLPLVELIHAVDSERLLLALEAEGARRGQPVDVLLEVNASRESAKQGFAPEAVPSLVDRLAELHCLRVRGLMAMAAFTVDAEQCRSTFAVVRKLRDQLRGELPATHRCEALSMGMSNDF